MKKLMISGMLLALAGIVFVEPKQVSGVPHGP